jgi:hypothetical protein
MWIIFNASLQLSSLPSCHHLYFNAFASSLSTQSSLRLPADNLGGRI